MKTKKHRIKLLTVLIAEFLAIVVILLLIFFAGKRVYTVTFDLNGGTLLSGDVVQKVTQGQSAIAPSVTKDGCYFLKWSASYSRVTRDVEVKAIWEYETTPGIEYSTSTEGLESNYCEITGCFYGLTGDVYIGAYHGEKKVLSIRAGAFANCDGITSVHLLDGILVIEDGAFAGCSNLETIELPSTVVTLGKDVFKGCEKLTSIELPKDLKTLGESAFEGCTALENVTFYEGLQEIGENAFAGCNALKEIVLPKTLQRIGNNAFTCEELIICLYIKEKEKPETWAENWNGGNAELVWEYVLPEPEDDEDKKER